MCDAKPVGRGTRLMTSGGLVYYPNTPSGHIAAAEDGAGKSGQEPPSSEENPEPPVGCDGWPEVITQTDMDKPVSKYFKLGHCKYLPVAQRGLKASDVACNWQKVCTQIMDKVVDKFGMVTVHSGFRTEAFEAQLNGGKPRTSDHGLGGTIDFSWGGSNQKLKDAFKWMGSEASSLGYSQIIYEGGWIHVALGGVSVPAARYMWGYDAASIKVSSPQGMPPDLRWV